MDNRDAQAWDQIEKYAFEHDGYLVRSKDVFWFELFGGAMRLRFDHRGYVAIVRQEIVPRFSVTISGNQSTWRVDDRMVPMFGGAWAAKGPAQGIIKEIHMRMAELPSKRAAVELDPSGVGRVLYEALVDEFTLDAVPVGNRRSRTRSFSAPVMGDLVFVLEAITSRPDWSTINEWEL